MQKIKTMEKIAIVFRCVNAANDVYRRVYVTTKDLVDKAVDDAYANGMEIFDYEITDVTEFFAK